MKLYRVYKPFHDPSESGTREFGIFTSLAKAEDMQKKALHDFPDDPFESGSVYIHEYDSDVEISEEIVGYT